MDNIERITEELQCSEQAIPCSDTLAEIAEMEIMSLNKLFMIPDHLMIRNNRREQRELTQFDSKLVIEMPKVPDTRAEQNTKCINDPVKVEQSDSHTDNNAKEAEEQKCTVAQAEQAQPIIEEAKNQSDQNQGLEQPQKIFEKQNIESTKQDENNAVIGTDSDPDATVAPAQPIAAGEE